MLSKRVGAALAVTAVVATGVLWWVRTWDSGGFCTATNSAEWETALHRHSLPSGTRDDQPLYPPLGSGQLHVLPHELQLRRPDGTQRRLLAVPGGESLGAVSAGDGWLVVSLYSTSKPNRTMAFVAVRLTDGRTVTVDRLRTGRTLDKPWLVDGAVWWSDRTSDRRVAHRLDLTTGARTVAGTTRRMGQTLLVTTQGVGWSAVGTDLVSRRALPGPVEKALSGTKAILVTDGTAYAWGDRKGIRWWRPGPPSVTLTRYPDGRTWLAGSIAGPFVFVDRNSESSDAGVLDVRSGALLDVKDRRPLGAVFPGALQDLYSPYAPPQYAVVPSDLPELHC